MAFAYPAMVAWNPATGRPAAGVAFQVYATTDSGFTTPLTIIDRTGNPVTMLNSDAYGIIPDFMMTSYASVVVSDAPHTYSWTVIAEQPPTQDGNVAQWVLDRGSQTFAALSSLFPPQTDMPMNVRDYGAVGDGVHDDTAAIQAALNAVPVGGATVFMPAGRYKVTSTINIVMDGTKLYGAGAAYKVGGVQDGRCTRIEAAAGVTGSVLLVQGTANTQPLDGVTLTDFTIDGGLVGTGVDGIVFRSNQGHVTRVHVWRCSGNGIRILGYVTPAVWETYDTTFHNCIFGYNTLAGAYLDASSSDMHWSHCIFISNQDNWVTVGGSSQQVTGCHFYTPTRHDVYFNGAGTRSKFANCKFEGAGDDIFLIDTTVAGYSDIQITGSGFSSLSSSAATNTYSYFKITGTSANGCSRTMLVGNNFNLKGGSTVKAQYAINLDSSAAQNTVIVGNAFGPSSHWGTGVLRNNSFSSLTQFIKGNFGLPDLTLPVAQTANYTLAATDANGVVVEMNSATAVTVTVPTSATSGMAKGTEIELTQTGAGQVTIAAAAGVTLHTPRSLTTRAQYSTIRLRMTATDSWVLSGDLT